MLWKVSQCLTCAGNYSESAFRALDTIIAKAAQYGIRLILTFADNWSLADSKHNVRTLVACSLGSPVFAPLAACRSHWPCQDCLDVLLQYLTWSGQTTNNSFFTETGPGSAYALYTNHIGVMANRTVSDSITMWCQVFGTRADSFSGWWCG